MIRCKAGQYNPCSAWRDCFGYRLLIINRFAEIEAARDRGVSWQEIADLMAADGVRGLDGKMPTQSTVRALYHKEKYTRDGKRKKRRGSKPAPAAMRADAALP